MRINHKPGTLVVFDGKGGWEADVRAATKAGLQVGETYEVERLDVHNWHSTYVLKNIDGYFNTMMFVEAPDA